MIKLDIHSLQHFFEKQKFTTKIIEASEEIPFDALFISIGDEEAGQSIIQIRIMEQIVDEDEDNIGIKQNSKGYFHIQFTVPIDISINEKYMSEVGRLVLLINRTCNLPGFEFNEIERVLYYRYAMLISGNTIDPYVVVSIIGTIMLYVTTFSDYLRDIGDGSKTFRDVIEEFQKIQTSVAK